MYSITLMMALTAPADLPAFHRPGLLLAPRAGCAGTTAVRAHFVAQAPVRGAVVRVRERLHDRPRFFVVREHAPRSSYGCAGTTFAVPRAAGCTGGTVTLVGPTLMPPGPPAIAEAASAGPLTRLRIHRQLRIALGRANDGNFTASQKDTARRALADPDLYEAAVTKVYRDLAKKMGGERPVMGIGDGHLLELLIRNLPAIIDAIKMILDLFGLAAPSFGPMPCGGEWAPMPRGPVPQAVYPPGPAPLPAAWSAC